MKNSQQHILDQTRKLWRTRFNIELTEEDARQAVENVVGFFQVLKEWDERGTQTIQESSNGNIGAQANDRSRAGS